MEPGKIEACIYRNPAIGEAAVLGACRSKCPTLSCSMKSSPGTSTAKTD
jgi:hypothetical protein